jgi:hypothetical protein
LSIILYLKDFLVKYKMFLTSFVRKTPSLTFLATWVVLVDSWPAFMMPTKLSPVASLALQLRVLLPVDNALVYVFLFLYLILSNHYRCS